MPSAVISYLWEKHLGALDEFLAASPVDAVVVPSVHHTERLEKIAARRGSAVIELESVPTGRHVPARNARKVLEALHEHLAESDWGPADVVFADRHLDELRALVRHRIDTDIPPAVDVLDRLAAVRSTYDVRLFVTSEDVTDLPKVAATWAKAWQVPSLHLAHSLALIDPYTVHAHLCTDVLAVYGPRGAEGYRDLGIDTDRIVVTGNPAWDGYAELRADRASLRAGLVAKHELRPGFPIVVFGTTWSARLTALDTGEAYHRSLAAFVDACCELEQMGLRFTPVVKDRDIDSDVGDTALQNLLGTSGFGGTMVHTCDDGPAWAAVADVLVAVDSNYLVEAMLCGTPAVNLIGTAMLPGPPAFDGASGVVEAEPAELATRLHELVQDPDVRARRIAQTASRIEHYNVGGVDGQSATRVASEMGRLARAGSRQGRTSPKRLHQRIRNAFDVVVGQVRKQR